MEFQLNGHYRIAAIIIINDWGRDFGYSMPLLASWPRLDVLRPSTVERANEGENTLFDTVDALFDTVDREGVGNEEGANLLLLPPLWSALGLTPHQTQQSK